MKNKLADFNFFYSLFLPVVGFGVRCHYRNIVIRGKENIPWGEHIIFAPCHQNALMDALIILQVTRGKTVFLARADIFKKPLVKSILTWLRISPVYRIRDGRDQLSRNDVIFQTSREVIHAAVPLCLMAEGRHNSRHQLLPLVKGMFRIAGSAQMELGGKPLYIVPVGIDYDHYEDLYHNVCVNIGQPIGIQDYIGEFESNQPVALNQMRSGLTSALKGLMHHVNDMEHYDDEYAYCHFKTQDTLRELKLPNTPWGRFMARKHVSEQLSVLTDEQTSSLYAEGAAYAEECHRRRVPLWFASKGWTPWKGVLSLLLVLVTLYGISYIWKLWLVCNLVVCLPTKLLVRRKIEDPQFRSSVDYGIRLILQLLNGIAAFVLFACTRGILWGLGALLLTMVSAWVTPKIFILLRDVWYGLKSHTISVTRSK